MEELKLMRTEKNITQKQAAEYTGISLRSYKTYETDPEKVGTIKYAYLLDKLAEYHHLDEKHGILEEKEIKKICQNIFQKYNVDFSYLFGSYAKQTAGPESDVDLLVATTVSGLRFYGMVEELRLALHKKVDVLNVEQLKGNYELVVEILRDGKKIYG